MIKRVETKIYPKRSNIEFVTYHECFLYLLHLISDCNCKTSFSLRIDPWNVMTIPITLFGRGLFFEIVILINYSLTKMNVYS